MSNKVKSCNMPYLKYAKSYANAYLKFEVLDSMPLKVSVLALVPNFDIGNSLEHAVENALIWYLEKWIEWQKLKRPCKSINFTNFSWCLPFDLPWTLHIFVKCIFFFEFMFELWQKHCRYYRPYSYGLMQDLTTIWKVT